MFVVRWGILGTGNVVSRSFLPAIRALGAEAKVRAVASRTAERALAFAQQEGIDRGQEGYRALIERDDIDVVYVALPNHLHEEWTLSALKAGKHVLAEKPLGLNPASVRRMIEAAQTNQRFLWEAYAFPFREQTHQLQDLVDSGVVGEVRNIQSLLCSTIPKGDIRWIKEFGGGALYDMGVYPLRLASLWFQGGQRFSSDTTLLGEVDGEASAQIQFSTGATLQFAVSMNRAYQSSAILSGQKGRLYLTNPFHPGPNDAILLSQPGGLREFRVTRQSLGFYPLVRHIQAALAGVEEPRHLAQDSALRVSELLFGLRQSSRG